MAQTAFTAGVFLERMPQEERYPFLAGVIEGLAHARYLKDGKDSAGRGCIYQWFYETPGVTLKIYDAFRRYPDHLPGPIILALSKPACGG